MLSSPCRRCITRARRHYGTVVTHEDKKQPEYDARLRDRKAQVTQRVWSGALQTEVAKPAPRPEPRFQVPSVLLPADVANSTTHQHKIHILGHDQRSRFIAHALSSIYDSVQMIPTIYDDRSLSVSQYTNVMNFSGKNRDGQYDLQENAGLHFEDKTDKSRIDRLIVTGYGSDALPLLKSVQDRIDKDTSVCLATDGLGVLEDVREKIFKEGTEVPKFLLGHMTHRLAFNDRYRALKLLKKGQMHLTAVDFTRSSMFPYSHREDIDQMLFINQLRSSQYLGAKSDPYDSWLRAKLPSVIFESVVDPVCVLLDLKYGELFSNSRALTLMRHLLEEILSVVAQQPETVNSELIQQYIKSGSIQWFLRMAVEGKGSMTPPDLGKRLRKGVPADGRYHNAYFIKRAKALSIRVPKNEMISEMIKVREEQAKKEMDAHVPFLETSLPNQYSYAEKPSMGQSRHKRRQDQTKEDLPTQEIYRQFNARRSRVV